MRRMSQPRCAAGAVQGMVIFASTGIRKSPCKTANRVPTVIPNTSWRRLSVGMRSTSCPFGCAVPGWDSRLPPGRTLAAQIARNLLQARLDGVDYRTNAARPGEVRVHDEPEVLQIDRRVGKDPSQVPLGVADVTGQGADPDPQRDGAQERERG